MLVYIEELGEWFNSDNTPIMLQLSPQDKKRIENMPRDHERYLSAPRDTPGVKMNSILQKAPPIRKLNSGLDNLNIDGVASVKDDDD